MTEKKEHSGGVPDYAFECTEWTEESYAVPIVHADISDKLEDVVAEYVERGSPITPLVVAAARRMARDESGRILCRAMAMVLDAKNPHLFVHQLLWSLGMADETCPALAKRYGISKQAFDQGAQRISESLGLRKSRMMRDEQSRKRMSLRNSRHSKI